MSYFNKLHSNRVSSLLQFAYIELCVNNKKKRKPVSNRVKGHNGVQRKAQRAQGEQEEMPRAQGKPEMCN